MSWLLKKVVHNEAMKEDPKVIYGWRVFMLACSVRMIIPICWCDTDLSKGLLWRNALWDGLWYYWWCPDHGWIQEVSFSLFIIMANRLTIPIVEHTDWKIPPKLPKQT
jgi:hypothetical protein